MNRKERISIARNTFGAWPDKPEHVSKWEWAALWKRVAKKNRRELRKYKAAWRLQKELNRDMTLEVIALRIELERIADAKASGENTLAPP